jgi:Spy/CpxP family protein refolding chaperone
MRSTRTLAAAVAAVLLAMPVARAADLPPLAPPPLPEFSGWYLRGNVGMTNQQVNSL